ncbi:MAG TPA: hypothetical protein VGM94_09785 [Galbitalea sp.]|jgi:hypothetical protein
MVDVARLVHDLGGMAQKRQLVARGARDIDLTRAVHSGEVIRVRNGWYSTMADGSPEVQAVRVGGRLTGISAIIALGGWVLGRHPLHVSVNGNAARLRSPRNRRVRFGAKSSRGVTLHWDHGELASRGSSMSVGLVDALLAVVLDESLETAVAALDWALHTGILDVIDFETVISRLPRDRRGIRDWVDPACESLPESLARTRFRLAGRRVETQVRMVGDRRIDLVVDGVAGVEVDGEEFHLTKFDADRSKDVDITMMRLHALRPTARMVFHEWDRVAQMVDAAIAMHVNAPRGSENSGSRARSPYGNGGLAGWRRRPRRRSPEFSRCGEKQHRRRGRARRE